MVYGFGRRLPRWMQSALAVQVRVPVLRRLLAEPRVEPPPVCGWIAWRAIREEVQRRNGQPSLEWIHFHSQWGKERSSMLGLDPMARRACSWWSSPEKQSNLHGRVPSTRSFRVTACTDSFSHESWSVRQYEPLPRLHRPASWNAERIRRVSEDVSLALEGVLPPARRHPASLAADAR